MTLRMLTVGALAAGFLAVGAAHAQQQSPAASPPPPPPAYGAPVTTEEAKKAVAAALAEGKTRLVFAVVDPSGNLVYFEKMDGAPYASSEISIRKARTSAFKRPSMAFFEQMEGGHNYVMTLSPELIASGGGLPLVVDGRIVGAIGVSGSPSGLLDQTAAEAAVNALK
ncbi:MAG: heme-binding protein [Xanthobacteraceae bacterium]